MQSVQPLEHLVANAKEYIKQGCLEEGRAQLRDYLLHDNALLWLARVAEDPQEALAAAELAMRLAPENEIARRAFVAVQRESNDGRAGVSKAITLRTGMSLAQVQAVIWPFRGVQRPIGEAIADGSVTSTDLVWAAQNAYESRIREAAKTVLYHEVLGVEAEAVSPTPTVINVSRYTEYEERRSLFLFSALLTIATLLLVFCIVMWLLLAFGIIQISSFLNLAIAVSLLLLIVGSMRLSERFEEQADQYRVGRHGEEAVTEVLRQRLDGHWTVFRNFEWANEKWGDIDLLLVGPAGVCALEVKAYSGQIRNIGDRWEKRSKWRWYPLSRHPGKQARRNAVRVYEYLQGQPVSIKWVQPVVVWAAGYKAEGGETGELELHNPKTPVWQLDQLEKQLDELWQGKPSLSSEQVKEIVASLSRAAVEH